MSFQLSALGVGRWGLTVGYLGEYLVRNETQAGERNGTGGGDVFRMIEREQEILGCGGPPPDRNERKRNEYYDVNEMEVVTIYKWVDLSIVLLFADLQTETIHLYLHPPLVVLLSSPLAYIACACRSNKRRSKGSKKKKKSLIFPRSAPLLT